MSSFNKDKGIAAVLTVVVHALVVLLALKLALVTPLPLPGEEGVEVDMGYYNQGMGYVQPVTPPAPIQAPEEQQIDEPNPIQEQIEEPEPIAEQPTEDLLAENTEEAPTIEEPKEEEKVEEPVQEETPKAEKPKKEVNQRALFKPSSSGQNDPSASQGNTEGVGDMGNPNGLANVNRYDGQTQHGNGFSYNLGNRGAKNIVKPEKTEFNEGGTIVVSIWVNKNGVVTKCEIAKGTTISDERLRNIAMEAAKNSSFAEDANAPEMQKGTITYIFKIGE